MCGMGVGAGVRAFRPLGCNDDELGGRLDDPVAVLSAAVAEAESDNWRTEQHLLFERPGRPRVAVVLPCFAVVLNAAFVLMDDPDSADCLQAIDSMASVLKSALVSSCSIACGQNNDVSDSNAIEYVLMRVWGIAASSNVEACLCADAAHLLMPVCVGDVQLVGDASHVRVAGDSQALAFRQLLEDDAELAGCLDDPVAEVGSAIHVRLCTYGGHLLMAVCVGDFQEASVLLGDTFLWLEDARFAGPLHAIGSPATLITCALVSSCCIACAQSNNIESSQEAASDDAVLAGCLHATGSTLPVLKSALVSSCRIACAQSNNISSVIRTALCANGVHLLMPVCVGDVQEDDPELAGSLHAIDSTVAVLKSPLVSSRRIGCAQTTINSSNTISYVSVGRSRIGSPYCVEAWSITCAWRSGQLFPAYEIPMQARP
ncbi:hypothetical protein cyc_01548 [Cyclospora cayetanensis]|uniref:Uncharacterized protein n=1 Tax=Cyclospora cayetanensis TaxID=88456 RepID=A0A1D3CUZ5_9EIME|nr:hypothetical protein cyc_01548 [Cyclospora cayetanensis]